MPRRLGDSHNMVENWENEVRPRRRRRTEWPSRAQIRKRKRGTRRPTRSLLTHDPSPHSFLSLCIFISTSAFEQPTSYCKGSSSQRSFCDECLPLVPPPIDPLRQHRRALYTGHPGCHQNGSLQPQSQESGCPARGRTDTERESQILEASSQYAQTFMRTRDSNTNTCRYRFQAAEAEGMATYPDT